MISSRWHKYFIAYAAFLSLCLSPFYLHGNVLEELESSSYENSILATDNFLGNPAFEESFKDGDEIKFEMEDCIGSSGPCDTMKTTASVNIYETQGEPVAYISYVTGGSNGQPEQIKKSTWENAKGNMLRLHIAVLESYGFKTEIKSIVDSQKKLLIGNEEKSVETLNVKLSAVNAVGMTNNFEIELAKILPGCSQMVQKIEKQGGFFPSTRKRIIKSVSRALY